MKTGIAAYTEWAIAHPWHVSGVEPRPPVPIDCDCMVCTERRNVAKHDCGPLCPEHGDPRDTSIR